MARAKATGIYQTREDLESQVYLLVAGNQLGDTEVSNVVGVSAITVSNIYKSYKPTLLIRIEALNRKIHILKSKGENVDYLNNALAQLNAEIVFL